MGDTDPATVVGSENDASGDAARIAEYQTLRAESDRSAQLLSNAVWIGVTGFGLTLAGAAAASTNGLQPVVVPSVAILLAIQSCAITMLYGSELWKYIRVGTYIRVYIERYFCRHREKVYGPMHWETWIAGHRALGLHFAALLFLQSPILVIGMLLGALAIGWLEGLAGVSIRYLRYLNVDPVLVWVLRLIVILDGGLICFLGLKLFKAARKQDFGDGGISVRDLVQAVAENIQQR